MSLHSLLPYAALAAVTATFLLPLSLRAQTTAKPSKPAAASSDTVDAATYNGWKTYRLLCDRCHGEEAQGTSFGPNLLAALKPNSTIPNKEAFIALLKTGRPDRGMPSAATLGLAPEQMEGLYNYLAGRSSGKLVGGRPTQAGS